MFFFENILNEELQFAQRRDLLAMLCSETCTKMHSRPNYIPSVHYLKNITNVICDITGETGDSKEIRRSLLMAMFVALRTHSHSMSETQREKIAKLLQQSDESFDAASGDHGATTDGAPSNWPMDLMQVTIFDSAQEKINAWFSFVHVCMSLFSEYSASRVF